MLKIIRCSSFTLALFSPILIASPNKQFDMLLAMSLDELANVPVKSASKFEQTLEDIPASISLLTREDIRNYGHTTLVEVLRNMPGLFLEENTRDVFLGTRGSIGGGIQLLVNGIPQHPSQQKTLSAPEINRLNIPVAAIDRIEFIRGPMSVIYGNNAFFGVLNIITDQGAGQLTRVAAGDHRNGELFVRYGDSGDEYHYVLNMGISQEGSFSGDYDDMLGSDQNGFLTASHQQTMDGNMERTLGSVDFSGNWNELSVTARYQHYDAPVYLALPPIDHNDLDVDTWHASIEYDTSMNPQWNSRSLLIASSESYELDDIHIISPLLTGYQDQRSRRYEFEQNLVYSPSADKQLLLGYRFLYLDDIQHDNEIWLSNSLILDAKLDVKPYHQQELFVQWHQDLGEQLSLVAGARYTRLQDAIEYDWERDKAGTPTQRYVIDSNDPNLFNYRLAFLYQLNDDNQLKLMYGTATQEHQSQWVNRPEEIRTTELAHIFESEHWLLTQSVYYNEIDNLLRIIAQANPVDNTLFTDHRDDGQWTGYGYELQVEYRPHVNWRLIGSLNVQRSEDQLSTLDIGYSPTQLLKLKSDFRHHKNTYAVYAHYVGARKSDWRMQDTNGDGLADFPERLGDAADAYWNIGINWGYDLNENWHANLNISNLFDEEFRYPANDVNTLKRGLIGVGRVITLATELSLD